MGSPGVKHLCRSGFAGRAPITRSPTTSTRSTNWSPRRCPGAMGGRVLLPPHPCRFVYPRDTAPLFGLPLCTTHPLHGRSHDRNGALWNVRQTGLDKLSTVREKLADLVCYREGINAHLIASIAEAHRSPGGLLMPHQSLLYAGRVHACANLAYMCTSRASSAAVRSALRRMRHPSPRRVRVNGSRNSTPSTTGGRPKTAANCWPLSAIC